MENLELLFCFWSYKKNDGNSELNEIIGLELNCTFPPTLQLTIYQIIYNSSILFIHLTT